MKNTSCCTNGMSRPGVFSPRWTAPRAQRESVQLALLDDDDLCDEAPSLVARRGKTGRCEKVRTPKEIQIAVKSFLEASKMMVEEKLDYLPGEYLANLLETLQKYPEYNNVTMDLVRTILKED